MDSTNDMSLTSDFIPCVKLEVVSTIGAPGHRILPALNHLARVGSRAADGALAPTGLRPRHLVALMLLEGHGPSSQQALVEALSLDPSNLVVLLNELEERGLVTRRRDPADRRRHIVDISAKGRTKLTVAQDRLSRAEDDLLRGLTDDERATLHELLLRLLGGQFTVASCTGADEAPVIDCPATA